MKNQVKSGMIINLRNLRDNQQFREINFKDGIEKGKENKTKVLRKNEVKQVPDIIKPFKNSLKLKQNLENIEKNSSYAIQEQNYSKFNEAYNTQIKKINSVLEKPSEKLIQNSNSGDEIIEESPISIHNKGNMEEKLKKIKNNPFLKDSLNEKKIMEVKRSIEISKELSFNDSINSNTPRKKIYLQSKNEFCNFDEAEKNVIIILFSYMMV